MWTCLHAACNTNTIRKNNRNHCTTTSSDKLKAGFIYVGPIGDYGWTNAHDVGRVIVEEKYDWLETVYIESVAEDPAAVVAAVDTLVEVEKCDVDIA